MQPRTPCGMGLRGANKEFYHAATHLMYWHRVRSHLVGRVVTLVTKLRQALLAPSPSVVEIGLRDWPVCLAAFRFVPRRGRPNVRVARRVLASGILPRRRVPGICLLLPLLARATAQRRACP